MHVEETVVAKRQLYVQEAGEEIPRYDNASVNYPREPVAEINIWDHLPKVPFEEKNFVRQD